MSEPAEDALGGLLLRVSEIEEPSRRADFIARHAELRTEEAVRRMADEVHRIVRVDARQALRLAETGVVVSQALSDRTLLAVSVRAEGNAAFALGENRRALEKYEEATELLREAGQQTEMARTASSCIQPLILLGEYGKAFGVAEFAREIFRQQGDEHRLARLQLNVGNIFHRQDRFDEALKCYEDAYQHLKTTDDEEAIAAALSNLAVCLIALNEYPRALSTYQRAREFCGEHGMPRLVVQADYNIAYLHYLRGEYQRALEGLRATREASRTIGDHYHAALCDLDQSEIYLELNLFPEAANMAEEALAAFERLETNHEAAKSMANLAIAHSHQKRISAALELFERARSVLVREKNVVWPWLIDLYRAVVLFNEGRFFEARRLGEQALRFFNASPLKGKAVLCHLLLARLFLGVGDMTAARREGAAAEKLLEKLHSPLLQYQTNLLFGEIEDLEHRREAAYGFYEAARRHLETLRSSLQDDELRISFFRNRLVVYEYLVGLSMSEPDNPAAPARSFNYMELARSRSLMDLLLSRKKAAPAWQASGSEAAATTRELRDELNWFHHRIRQEELGGGSPAHLERLKALMRVCEDRLLEALRELPGAKPNLDSAKALPLEEVRAALLPGTVLVEYFRVAGRLLAAVLSAEKLRVVPLGQGDRVNNIVRMLRFQLAKFRLGGHYVDAFRDVLLHSTQAHLGELYRELLLPLRPHIQGDHLIVVPHGILHQLPFHALFDGRNYVIDSFSVSYAPSASVYALCCRGGETHTRKALLMGVPDPGAPFIREEIEAAGAILPDATVLMGDQADEEALRKKGAHSQLIHIAAHGHLREDNPMFSAIRLGKTYLNLYDLYQLRLPAGLVTLSGCATGLNRVLEGDELLGLVRGFLYAGAQSVLATLWDVRDASTAEFMTSFYRRWSDSEDVSVAVREAMLELRERYSHPYYWAPFVLVGRFRKA